MASSHKKVVLRTTNDTVLPAYLPQSGWLVSRTVSLLDLEGRIVNVPLETVRWIAYVRDFNLSDKADPERLSRRTFLARPRTEGLWLRVTLAGGDVLEGLAPIDASLLDGLLDDGGLYLIPPDIRSNTQRLFLPRGVIAEMQLLAVITNPSRVKPVEPVRTKVTTQESLFPNAADQATQRR